MNLKRLDRMKKNDQKKEIKIISTEVFCNPFRDTIKELLIKDCIDKKKDEKEDEEKVNFRKMDKIEKNLNVNLQANEEFSVGKYLNNKRNLSQLIGIQSQDPYLFEKPNLGKKLGEFDYTNW